MSEITIPGELMEGEKVEEQTYALPVPPRRTLFLDTDISADSVGVITRQIIAINDADEHLVKLYSLHDLTYAPKPIRLFINSYGGDLYSCLGILSFIENSKTPVHTIVTGSAMSAGFLISISASRKFCYKNSTFMIHQLSFGSGEGQTLKSIADDVAEGKRIQKVAEQHVLRHTKITPANLKKLYNSQKDVYYSAEEALELGIVDEIL